MGISLSNRLDTLPPLPYVAHEILLALNEREAHLRNIADTLAREPSLTARIVSMANSAFFSGQRPVFSAEDAIVRLGLNRVRVLAASILLAKQFDTARCRPFRPERYWFDAVGCAFAAARLGRYLATPVSEDVAYLAGLLHNIGLLLLVNVFPDEMAGALDLYESDREQSLASLIRQTLGSDHHEAGRLLLAEWGLPEEIIATAGHVHEAHYRGPHQPLVQLIAFCSRWTQCDYDEAPQPAEWLGLTAERLETVAAACRREREQLEAFSRLLATG